jgi:hypothetical protein
MGCMSCLYICLYTQFEILQTAGRVWAVHGNDCLLRSLFLRACTTGVCRPSTSRHFCKNVLHSARRRVRRRLTRGRPGLVLREPKDGFAARCTCRLHLTTESQDLLWLNFLWLKKTAMAEVPCLTGAHCGRRSPTPRPVAACWTSHRATQTEPRRLSETPSAGHRTSRCHSWLLLAWPPHWDKIERERKESQGARRKQDSRVTDSW